MKKFAAIPLFLLFAASLFGQAVKPLAQVRFDSPKSLFQSVFAFAKNIQPDPSYETALAMMGTLYGAPEFAGVSSQDGAALCIFNLGDEAAPQILSILAMKTDETSAIYKSVSNAAKTPQGSVGIPYIYENGWLSIIFNAPDGFDTVAAAPYANLAVALAKRPATTQIEAKLSADFLTGFLTKKTALNKDLSTEISKLIDQIESFDFSARFSAQGLNFSASVKAKDSANLAYIFNNSSDPKPIPETGFINPEAAILVFSTFTYSKTADKITETIAPFIKYFYPADKVEEVKAAMKASMLKSGGTLAESIDLNKDPALTQVIAASAASMTFAELEQNFASVGAYSLDYSKILDAQNDGFAEISRMSGVNTSFKTSKIQIGGADVLKTDFVTNLKSPSVNSLGVVNTTQTSITQTYYYALSGGYLIMSSSQGALETALKCGPSKSPKTISSDFACDINVDKILRTFEINPDFGGSEGIKYDTISINGRFGDSALTFKTFLPASNIKKLVMFIDKMNKADASAQPANPPVR